MESKLGSMTVKDLSLGNSIVVRKKGKNNLWLMWTAHGQ